MGQVASGILTLLLAGFIHFINRFNAFFQRNFCFPGPDLLEYPDQVGGVCEITIVQDEVSFFFMGVLVEMVDSVCIKQGRSSFNAVDLIAFVEQEFCKIGAVLACYTCYESFFAHGFPVLCIFNFPARALRAFSSP